jgi:hypothetical protein
MSLFLFFIFSVLGLSLTYLMQISLRVSASKKKSVALSYAAEVGLKQGWEQWTGILSGRRFPRVISEERLLELREAFPARSGLLVAEALGAAPPLTLGGQWQNQSWEARTEFSLERSRVEDDYFQADFKAGTVSQGTIPSARGKHSASSESLLEIAAGRVPLSFFPLLVNEPSDPAEAQNYAEAHRITFSPLERGLVVPPLSFGPAGLLPQDACSALGDVLRLKIFKPQDLGVRSLREALGLESSLDPVPEGVYLIHTDLGLGGIYVQGDLDELILAVDQVSQVLFFRSATAGCWILRIDPASSRTSFETPLETLLYDLVPAGTVVVAGKIRSLGGGRPSPSGDYVICPEEEVGCLLHGLSLTIVSSDTMTLTSHLIREGVRWQNGIPYLKEADSKLTLFATGQDWLSASPTEGGIVIGEEAPADLKIEASLVAPGAGFVLKGEAQTVRIAGSLQASVIRSGTGSLALTYDARTRGSGTVAAAMPETALPVLMVKGMRLLQWTDQP